MEQENKIVYFEKCGAYIWIWELPFKSAYCRLYDNVSECEGPKEMRNKLFMRDINYENMVFGTIINGIFRRTLYKYDFDEYYWKRYKIAFPTIILLELTEHKINNIEIWDEKLKQTYLTNVDLILSSGEITTWKEKAFRTISVQKIQVIKKRHFI